jgi:hypothetical protein
VNAPIGYSRRGGASIGWRTGSWPFGKIEISPGSVTISVLGKSRTLRVAEVLRVESFGFLTAEEGPGVRIFFRGQHWEEFVDFYSFFGRDDVLDELKKAGFNVVEKSGS